MKTSIKLSHIKIVNPIICMVSSRNLVSSSFVVSVSGILVIFHFNQPLLNSIDYLELIKNVTVLIIKSMEFRSQDVLKIILLLSGILISTRRFRITQTKSLSIWGITWMTQGEYKLINGSAQNDLSQLFSQIMKKNPNWILDFIFLEPQIIHISFIASRRFIPVTQSSIEREVKIFTSLTGLTLQLVANNRNNNVKKCIIFPEIPNMNSLSNLLNEFFNQIQLHISFTYNTTKSGSIDYQPFRFLIFVEYPKEEKNTEKILTAIIRTISTESNIQNSLKWKKIDIFELQKIELILKNANKSDYILENKGTLKEFSQLNVYSINQKDRDAKTSTILTTADLDHGGIICGSIGMGKTTLRLHLMKMLISSGYYVVDFDLKGEASRYDWFQKRGKIIVPGINLKINLFEKPSNFTVDQYTELLFRLFQETLGGKDELTPAQLKILYSAVQLTVKKNGNGLDFYKNILQVSYSSKELIENKQDMSANALPVKFSWLHTNLRSIFWTNGTTFLQNQKLDKSVYFDFSEIINFTPHRLVRFVIDVITTKLMVELDYSENMATNKKKFVIFIDEAQILMPAHPSSELSRLEDALSTFRYKGVAVVVTGISAEYISKIALETGFMAQFRSDSTLLLPRLGATGEDHRHNVTQLPKFHCYLRGLVTNTEVKIVSIADFSEEKQTEEAYQKWLSSNSIPSSLDLEKFKLSSELMWHARILANCAEELLFDHDTEYSYIKFVKRYLASKPKIDQRQLFSKNIDEIIDQWINEFIAELENIYRLHITDQELKEILLIFIAEIIMRLSQIVKDDNRINKLERDHKLMMQIAKKLIVNSIENRKQHYIINTS